MTHSFPTRRSSDLPKRPKWNGWKGRRRFDGRIESSLTQRREEKWPKGRFPDNLTQRHKEVGCVRDVAFSLLGERLAGLCPALFSQRWGRSEEHTSELQSLMRIPYAVFCLKKKK